MIEQIEHYHNEDTGRRETRVISDSPLRDALDWSYIHGVVSGHAIRPGSLVHVTRTDGIVKVPSAGDFTDLYFLTREQRIKVEEKDIA